MCRKSPIKKAAVLIVAVFLGTSGCRDAIRQVQKERVVKSALNLKSYSGVFSETYGTQKEPLVYDVDYNRDKDYFYAKVQSKGPLKGSVFYYNKEVVRLYYPTTGFGVEFKNLPVPTEGEKVSAIERSFDWHMETYRVALEGTRDLLNQTTVGIRYEALPKNRFYFDWQAWVIEDYAMPVQIQMEKDGQIFYQSQFTQVSVNPAGADKNIKSFRFPAGTTVARYNYASKKYTLAGVKAAANFRFQSLNAQSHGFELEKAVRVAGMIPGFTMFYKGRAGRLSITMVKDYGIKAVPAQAGLEVPLGKEGKRKGRLSFFGNQTVVNFKKKGVYYTLMGDAPYPIILSAADELGG